MKLCKPLYGMDTGSISTAVATCLAWATPPQALHAGAGVGHDSLKLSLTTVPNTVNYFIAHSCTGSLPLVHINHQADSSRYPPTHLTAGPPHFLLRFFSSLPSLCRRLTASSSFLRTLRSGSEPQMGNGCASVLNTYLSRGITSGSSEKRRKKYLRGRDRILGTHRGGRQDQLPGH